MLPRLFESHVLAAAAGAGSARRPSCARRAERPLRRQRRGGAARQLLPVRLDAFAEHAGRLRAVAVPLVRRAGRLAAGMAYFSLFHQLEQRGRALLSLDSTQARWLPGYFAALTEQLERLAAGKQARVALQQPEGEITVPMKGLAEALAEQLAALDND